MSVDLAVAASPLLDRRTTLKDALSLLLDADVQAGLVVDRTGALLGLVTADTIAGFMRETQVGPAPAIEASGAEVTAPAAEAGP